MAKSSAKIKTLVICMKIEISERDEFLITMYHCDHMRFAAFCSEEDCNRIDELNDELSDKERQTCIDNYNRRKFGVSFDECKERKCLLCKDRETCDIKNRKSYEDWAEKQRKETTHDPK